MQRIASDGPTSWFSSIVRQLEMKSVIDTRDMTIFLPSDEAYNSLSSGKKHTLKFYLNRLYYVFLQHLAIDRIYPTSKLRDGMVISAGIGNYIFVNIRENGAEKVSHRTSLHFFPFSIDNWFNQCDLMGKCNIEHQADRKNRRYFMEKLEPKS